MFPMVLAEGVDFARHVRGLVAVPYRKCYKVVEEVLAEILWILLSCN